jgi:ATP synthase protein I
VNSSDDSLQPATEELEQPSSLPPQTDSSMQEYHKLKQGLLVITIVLTGIIFVSVWIFYSLNIALNYLIGACTGMVYLRMLAKDVEQLGRQKDRLSKARFALFIGLIVVASRWQQLQILPIFLGFLTYKATLIVYMVQTLMPPDPHNGQTS